MNCSNIPAAQLVVQLFQAAGIQDIIISPGSRNAPLTLSFSAAPFFKCYSIVDERCAGFFALGIAQQKKKPVAVLCTSGSAVLNYYPAVAEAFYSRIPLLVISADRPPYKIDIGDGQTINQEGVFGKHIGYSANLLLDVDHAKETIAAQYPEHLRYEQSEIDQRNKTLLREALTLSIRENLPVHINIPFEEPLYGVAAIREVPTEIDFRNIEKPVSRIDYQKERRLWEASTRKLVLVGVCPPNSVEPALLELLANDPSVLVFTETTSNLHHPNFFPSIDTLLFPIERSDDPNEGFLALRPEILLTFGGMVVSKKIKAFLRKYQPKEHWHMDPYRAYNTFFSLTRHFKDIPNNCIEQLYAEQQHTPSDYFATWNALKLDYARKRSIYVNKAPFSDFTVFEALQKRIPNGYQVQLSNSSTVRYTQLFPMHPSLQVSCNRGTSGIDGSTSTAIGAALYAKNPTLLISGDLSFFYDGNALWNDYVRDDFRVVVINNGGGGIFRILPGFKEDGEQATFFETEHQFTAEHLCAMYGFSYNKVVDLDGLVASLSIFFQPGKGPKLMEVFTPRILNDRILLAYFDFISSGSQKHNYSKTLTIMSKRDELIEKYAVDIKEKFGETPDMDFLTKVAIGLGPAIYNADASKVSGTDEKELDTVKNNFLIKKLGLSDSPELMDAINRVIEKYGKSEKNKHRAVVYYQLAKHFGKEAIYN